MENTKYLHLGFAFAMTVLLCVGAGFAQDPIVQATVEDKQSQELSDRFVPNARMAEHLAIQAYLEKMGGIRAREGFHCSGVLLLGFPVEGFAQEGDEVWEVRMSGMNGNRPENTLRAILWVHPDTGKVYYVCGPWGQGGAESSTFEPPRAEGEHGTGE